jgi:NAD(P)H-dependent flavin oxidoreductase YrpB (nitropropane dioxygenase family)
MAKRKQQNLIKGNATHRRTEGDYMSTLLDTVTLDDWQDVVRSTLVAAKQGDAQARAWLAQYLVGKPAGKAPTPLTVVVQQLNGDNPLINRLSKTVIDQHKYPSLHEDDAWEDQIKAIIAAELAEKIPTIKTIVSPELARVTVDLDDKQSS